ncbi:MAG: phage tail tape measure protein [Dorea sp.]|jgi:TP901 family phage tail tape measure protein|nr:phage tail tape measure protein [Dorea sp.]
MAADGTIKINTELDSSKAQGALAKFSTTAKIALKGVAVAASAAGAAITAMAGYAVKVGSSFEEGMSKVSAISGAAGGDLEKLTDKAKEMGAKTKFSATEAASAFEYMAMAGWKTEDMLSGIEGIMNLAAASGEDLAATSDIVTDALTAFGMSASDSGRFADVLAAASSNANTNVGMMGETFKYVAPVAGALGFSVEDTAVAIGLMANSGIKASQAGTSLRSIMSRLAKPTDDVQIAMDALGISLTDSNGNMKSLNEVMGDLRNGFADLSEAEKASMAATLGGQEAMSGLLAIVNASDADFTALQNAINNADGAAEAMAETMQNNLKGSFTILGSALEGFGIQVYERMQEPLKKAVDEGTENVNRLARAFSSGGLKGVVSEAGEIFSRFADKVEDSSKIAGEIVGPLRNIASAGVNLGKTVLPTTTKAFKLLAENLDVAVPLLVSGVAAVKSYTVAKTAASMIKKLSTAYNASAIALDLFITANGTSAVVTAASTGAITLNQIAVGALSTQLPIATAAHAAFNAVVSANPIGLAVTAVAALTAGLIAYTVIVDEADEKTYKLSNSEKELLDSCNDLTDSLNDQRTAREKSVQSINTEYDGYQLLLAELQSITDENGKVKAGYEERASFIAGELSNALGTEIELTDGVIQNYQETVGALDEVITKKKAAALCASLEEEMASAYKNSQEALIAYKDATAVMEEKEAALAEAQRNLNEVTDMYGNNSGPKAMGAINEAKQAVSEAENAFNEASTAVDEASTSLNALSAEVNNYNALMEVMQNGTVAEIESAMNSLLSGYQGYTAEMLKTSETAKTSMLEQASEMTGALSILVSENGQMYQAWGEESANAAAKAVSEFQKLPDGIKEAIDSIGTDGAATMVAALTQADLDGKLSEESRASYEAFITGITDLPQDTQEVLSDAVEGAMEGLKGFDQIEDKAEEEGVSFLEALREVLQINSPSKKVMEIFEGVWEGASDGLDVGGEELNTKGTETCNSFLDTLRNSGLGEAMQGIGANIMSFFGIGVSSQQENSRNAGKANADAANSGAGSVDPTGTGTLFGGMLGSGVASTAGHLQQMGVNIANSADAGSGSVNPTGTGNNFGSMLGSGVSSTAGLLYSSGTNIANSADSGAGSVNPTGTGNEFGSQYADGVGSQAVNANKQGISLVENADSGAGSMTGYNSGSNFGAGFITGIGEWLGEAASAAASLAIAAYDALRSALSEHSPSRKAKKSGKNFDLGFKLGIEENAKTAISAAEELSKNTLDAINLDEISEKVRNLDITKTMARIQMAVEDRNETVAKKVTASVAAYERLKAGGDSSTPVTKEDMCSLLSDISRLTVNEIAETIGGMGVYMEGKPVGKLVASTVNMELGRINRRKT